MTTKTSLNMLFFEYILYIIVIFLMIEPTDAIIYDHIPHSNEDTIDHGVFLSTQNSTAALIPHTTTASTSNESFDDDLPLPLPARPPRRKETTSSMTATPSSCCNEGPTMRNTCTELLRGENQSTRPLSEIRYTAPPINNRTPSFYEVPVRTLPGLSEASNESFQETPQPNQASSFYEVPISVKETPKES